MAVMLLMVSYSALSQTPGQGIGRTLSEDEVNALMYLLDQREPSYLRVKALPRKVLCFIPRHAFFVMDQVD